MGGVWPLAYINYYSFPPLTASPKHSKAGSKNWVFCFPQMNGTEFGTFLHISFFSITKCAHCRIMNFKILHRAYITPSGLKKMDNSLSDLCWHGCGNVGTLAHCYLFCPAVKTLWNSVSVHNLKYTYKAFPATCLLGVQPTGINFLAQKMVTFACLTTKHIILENWKV